MNNEFTIKIISDSSGNEQSLNNISIEAADSLKVFIESLTRLAQTYDNYDNVKLVLSNGCVEASLVYPETESSITDDINDIINGNSYEPERTKILKAIQDRVKLNGLDYQVLFNVNNESQDLTRIFKSKRFPLKRGKRLSYQYEILFIKGHLFEAGGKSKTNIHIEGNGEEYKVECSRSQAIEINRRLYSEVFLSVLKKWKKEEDFEYELIDSYLTEDKFTFFKNLHSQFDNIEGLERYDFLHDKVVEIAENDSIDNLELIKLMRLYNNRNSDRGVLRTLLMSIKPLLRTNEGLKYYFNEMSERLRKGSVNNII